MSGSSLDGVDIIFTELNEKAGKWEFEILNSDCISYTKNWEEKLKNAVSLPAYDYQRLHSEYGHYLGELINSFIAKNNLHHQVHLIASHGHTTFHDPENKMTHQLGDGAAIAAITRLAVVCDLRALDVALGGQGAPIVPMGEKLLFHNHKFFLNIGGIANVSIHNENDSIAFDVCPANRVLNMLAAEEGLSYDKGGHLASKGNVHDLLYERLNQEDFYKLGGPKSLPNSFGTEIIFPMIDSFQISTADKLATFVEHIAFQVKESLKPYTKNEGQPLLITGGGAYNTFLTERILSHLTKINFTINLPTAEIIENKEALIMALLGILRLREEYTVDSSVTGADSSSIGGALWIGTEA